jgi:hypothetical protein
MELKLVVKSEKLLHARFHWEKTVMGRCFFVFTAAAVLAAGASIGPAAALDAKMREALQRLDPATRLTQACDAEALLRISYGHHRPEHVMIDQLSAPQKAGNTLSGTGAVFRAGGDWYHFSFKCQSAADQVTILAFTYTVGAKIRRDQWDRFNLYP